MHPILARRGRLGLYLALSVPLAGLVALLLVAVAPEPDWLAAAVLALPLAPVYATMCLASWTPVKHLPLGRTRALKLVATHASGAVLSSTLWVMLGWGWSRLLSSATELAGEALWQPARPVLFGAGVLLYLFAVVVHYLLAAFEEARAGEARALRLEVLAREAELKALKAQIDPHFLFNSLNSISALAGSDPEAARAMAIQLAAFLRTTVAAGREREIPLAEELDLARTYLAIEKVRFGERLRIAENVDEESLTRNVPPLLLQPLVENAVRHGIAHLLDGGEVRISVAVNGAALELAVENPVDPDRPSRDRHDRGGTGIGLANVRQRLALLFGRRASLETEEDDESYRALVRLPLETAEAAP